MTPSDLASELADDRRGYTALLLMDDHIVHVNVVEHRRQIFMTQQLLQAKGIVALEQVVHGKCVSEDMWADVSRPA